MKESNLFGKLIFIFAITLVSTSLGISSSVNAAAKEDALNAVSHFLNAQKNCNATEMMETSEHSQKISNIKEFYTGFCKEHPLEKAEITKLSMVNENLGIVSIHSTYKDVIRISSMPVVNKNGQWKIIRGVPGSGYVEFSENANQNSEESAIQEAINNYSKAIKSGELNKMKKHLKLLPEMNNEINKHLKSLSEGPSPEVSALGVRMLSDSVAMAQIETKYDHFSSTQNLVVCREDGQWKIVFGSNLENAGIPISEKPVEVIK